MACLAQIEGPDAADENVPEAKLKKPQRTLIVDDERPCPGGEAKGLWKADPEIPLTK